MGMKTIAPGCGVRASLAIFELTRTQENFYGGATELNPVYPRLSSWDIP